MIILTNHSSTTTQKLQMFLSGAAATTNPNVTVTSYIIRPNLDVEGDSDPLYFNEFTTLAGATETDVASAPDSGTIKKIVSISVYNADTTNVTITVCVDENGTNKIRRKNTLATLETLCYDTERGWYVIAANGAIKNGAGVSGPASSTDNAVARWDGTTGTVVQNSGVTIDDSNNTTVATILGTTTSGNALGNASASASTVLNLPAGTTAISSLRVAHGAAPTSPVDGDIWTTTAGLFVRINGVTVGPLS